ncbi:MAG: hypothetical protein C0618_05055 [Desulfuromonas sp.]|nr:MAG: hypothetical protein C0618_05055 [Desulfuromonas sp.]
MLINKNGHFLSAEQCSVEINDGGFLYGDTLFETLKARGQNILFTKAHLDRIESSAHLLNFPISRNTIETELKALSQRLSSPVSRIRLTLSRGPCDGFALPAANRSWFLLTATEATELSADDRVRGVPCVIAPNRRSNPLDHLPQMKRGNHADCLYAADFARRKGAHEALFCDNDGLILEGSCSNIFARRQNRLITPPLGNRVLAGVMRQAVLSVCYRYGLDAIEENLTLKDLLDADEVFLCNSMVDLLPVSAIGDRSLKRGEFWREILTRIDAMNETQPC